MVLEETKRHSTHEEKFPPYSSEEAGELARLFTKVSRACPASIAAQGFLIFYEWRERPGINFTQAAQDFMAPVFLDDPISPDLHALSTRVNDAHDRENEKKEATGQKPLRVVQRLEPKSAGVIVKQDFELAELFAQLARENQFDETELLWLKNRVIDELFPHYQALSKVGKEGDLDQVAETFVAHLTSILKREEEKFVEEQKHPALKSTYDPDKY